MSDTKNKYFENSKRNGPVRDEEVNSSLPEQCITNAKTGQKILLGGYARSNMQAATKYPSYRRHIQEICLMGAKQAAPCHSSESGLDWENGERLFKLSIETKVKYIDQGNMIFTYYLKRKRRKLKSERPN